MTKQIKGISLSTKKEHEFSSVCAASAFIGVDESSLRKRIKAGEYVYRGYLWSLIDKDNNSEEIKLPKILLLDIETAPIKAFVWQLWKQNVYLDQIISDWFMLTWSAKWLHSEEVMSSKLTSEEALDENDFRISSILWHILEEADIVIAHNGKRFDIPKINARFLYNGLGPTSPYRQIDTLEVAKKQFGFSSNKLEALARMFGFGSKLDTNFSLWAECLKGNEDALTYMEKYNIEDVILLEKVYLRIRPYIKNHPNIGLYTEAEKAVCPTCGSNDLKEAGVYHTHTGKYDSVRCNNCGAISRMRINKLPKGYLKTTTINTSY